MTDLRQAVMWIFTATIAVGITGCSRRPSDVIAPDEMAILMADIRMADAVVSVNARDYRTDSARQVLRQAVFDRNGVTSAQFDSSLVWYGHNIKEYQEVTDRSIEILEGRLSAAGAGSGQIAVSVAGDSVDVWTAPVSYNITRRSPSQFITFSLDADRNWERGDIYTWRFKQIVPGSEAVWAVTAEYDDGSIEVYNMTIPNSNSRPEITFYTDTTRSVANINGWLRVTPDGHRPAIIDSVSLVRRRVGPDGHSRNYRQVMYNVSDSTAR